MFGAFFWELADRVKNTLLCIAVDGVGCRVQEDLDIEYE